MPEILLSTVRDLGWAGKLDHILIAEIASCFDVFLTIDKGFEFEHGLKNLTYGIIVLTAANNQMPSYERLLEELIRQIQDITPGQLVHVRDPEC
jgi:hypothetical protein